MNHLTAALRVTRSQTQIWDILPDGGTVKTVLLVVLTVFAVILIVALVLWLRERRIYRRLNHLLDTAIEGSLLGETFNESRYSQLESKLYRYLKSSSLSRRQLEADRAQIEIGRAHV